MDDDEEGARAFSHFIATLAGGDAHADLSDRLHDLTKVLAHEAGVRCRAVKGTLSITLTLNVEPNGVVDVTDAAKTKEPDPVALRGVMWTTEGGNLVPDNPRQGTLPLREVGGRAGPAREVGGKVE
jgi:hypothetical protein